MKIVKLLIATVALSGALVTTAHARDSFSIGVNIGGHGHGHHRQHTLRTHRHAPAYYGYYRSAPRVVYYAPQVRYRHFRGDRHFGGRDFGHVQRSRHHFRGHNVDRNVRRHNRRHDNRGRGQVRNRR